MLRQEGHGALSWSSASSRWQPLLDMFPSGAASERRMRRSETQLHSVIKGGWAYLRVSSASDRSLFHSNLQGPGHGQVVSLSAASFSLSTLSPAGWLCISWSFRAQLSQRSSCITGDGVSVLSIQVSIGRSHRQCQLDSEISKACECAYVCMHVHVCVFKCVFIHI